MTSNVVIIIIIIVTAAIKVRLTHKNCKPIFGPIGYKYRSIKLLCIEPGTDNAQADLSEIEIWSGDRCHSAAATVF